MEKSNRLRNLIQINCILLVLLNVFPSDKIITRYYLSPVSTITQPTEQIIIDNCSIDNITLQDLLHQLMSLIKNSKQGNRIPEKLGYVAFATIESVNQVIENNETYERIFKYANFILPNDIYLTGVLKILGRPIKERITPNMVFNAILDQANTNGYKIMLLGDSDLNDSNNAAAIELNNTKDAIQAKYPGIILESYSPPFGYASYRSKETTDTAVEKIATSKTDILIVRDGGLPTLNWVFQYSKSLKVPLIIPGVSYKEYLSESNPSPDLEELLKVLSKIYNKLKKNKKIRVDQKIMEKYFLQQVLELIYNKNFSIKKKRKKTHNKSS